jgi:hypothetical protein
MEKIIKTLLIIALLLIIGMFCTLALQVITGQTIKEYYSYTKAICNESNFCQDYEITCINGDASEINPITGATIQHSKNWQDPRDKESIETLCW